jgi:hypothetical protein
MKRSITVGHPPQGKATLPCRPIIRLPHNGRRKNHAIPNRPLRRRLWRACQPIPTHAGGVQRAMFPDSGQIAPILSFPSVTSVTSCSIPIFRPRPIRVNSCNSRKKPVPSKTKNYQTNPFCDHDLYYNHNTLCAWSTKPNRKTNPFRVPSTRCSTLEVRGPMLPI